MHKDIDIYFFKNFINKDDAKYYIELIKNKYEQVGNINDFNTRTIDISNHPIVNKVKFFLEENLSLQLDCYEAQIQIWPVGSSSGLHIHDHKGREHGDYNSLLYLCDDFEGGEFITNFLEYKPELGTLTFFNGRYVHHGVNEVKKQHRFTLIFWWQNTKKL